MSVKTIIRGMGHYVPECILTNADLEKIVETNDEWITTRTGIKERRIVAPDQHLSDLCLEAAKQALDHAGLPAEAITHIIVATFSPDSYVPSSACTLQAKLGLRGRVAFDLGAACSGYLYALETARAIVNLHPDAVILAIGGDVVSSRTNYTDRATCVLFGDGAGASILTAATPEGQGAVIEDIMLASDGTLGDLLTVSGGGSAYPPKPGQAIGPEYFVCMQGRDVFKHAVRSMEHISVDLLTRNGLTAADVDLVIPHQANMRIIEALAKKMDVPMDKVFINLDRYGNMSAASLPTALSEAWDDGRLSSGSKVLLTSFGGGFTWAAGLLRIVQDCPPKTRLRPVTGM